MMVALERMRKHVDMILGEILDLIDEVRENLDSLERNIKLLNWHYREIITSLIEREVE